MKKRIAVYVLVMVSVLYFGDVTSAKLTNQQINLLLENDDIQIITPSSMVVKKSSLTIEKSTDSSQGKTIVEYDKKGLLINYYSASATGKTPEDKVTMIVTLMRTENDKWQRKQTMGDYEIDNSLYSLKGDYMQVTLLPSYNFDKKRLMLQKNQTIDSGKEFAVIFKYDKTLKKEKFNIEYQFNQDGLLNSFNFLNIDGNKKGYTSIVNTNFEYDDQQRLIRSNERSYYQLTNQAAEETIAKIMYSDFDRYGNWQTKIELFDEEQVIYKRTIEYW
ncbi:hypothetical protein RHO12_05515 [Orbus sturtevantii]|uniref:hypothetical protein n=1 Tax=Orbus sturtevantii TaxID=3074109 RepID=UPI00370DBD32